MTDVLKTLEKLPPMCAARNGVDGPVLLKRGVAGFWRACPDLDVDAFNSRHNVTPAQVQAMEIGSMFGWDAPGADPDLWVEG
jgi:hypothetical protein